MLSVAVWVVVLSSGLLWTVAVVCVQLVRCCRYVVLVVLMVVRCLVVLGLKSVVCLVRWAVGLTVS